MIIRYGGGNTGVAEYLENGRKVDRHYSRDELDRRIPIEGDLSVTQALYESIDDTGQERYLHISLSFNEPDVTEEDLREVFQQYKKELMAAYGDDEYNIYAEIHWPKVKEAYNHNTEQMEPRYPHVHVVIPKKNLVTGGFLNPAGMHEQHVKYLDAIQEKLNRDNGLSSPRNSPRVGTNHYESALAKYKDKEFKSKNGELKRHIFDSMLSRDIRTEKDFKSLLGEYGEVRVRNQSKDNQYFAVKLPGDEKFTNLKANIFGRQFIEERALVLEPITDAQVARRVETWRAIRSKEIKYIHNASAKVKAEYKSLSLPARREFLEKWERSYVERYKQANGDKRPGISGLSARDNLASNLKLAGGISTERARYLHELQASTVDYFDPQGQPANRLFLHGDADADIQHFQPERDSGLRSDLYDGSPAGGISPLPSDEPRSSVVDSLLAEESQRDKEKNDLARFAEIRKSLDPQHLLAFAQIKYGVDPAQHPISQAKDGSPRIKAGKYNYNVSDFLTKHIGLDWSEASGVLQNLYDRQQSGVVDRPKPKEQHIDDWRRFRNEIYPKTVKTYDELKGQIKISYALGLKAINAEFYARRASITKDATLNRFDKHYFRSIVILEKLQKVEDLQQRIKEQNSVANRAKYPYSTLFYDFATKNEDLNMKVLDDLKRRFQTPAMDSENTIGARGPLTPKHMPDGAEAAKRARLLAKLQTQEREAKELKIKLADLRPRPLANNAVAFCHKDHGKQIFVNHPDRLELNRVTDQDEVGVALIYGVERFGSPLEINGTEQFKEQVIQVAAERDMDITFTDEAMNKALEAKRLELGLQPLTANSIAPQELEIDMTIPKEQAIDKALLASKLAELRAINAGALEQPNEAEREIYAAVVAEAQERHEEMAAAPFLDSERIEEIAREDFQAFAQLEGQPEQQQLAISMAQALENEHYKSFAEQNGPQELQLTIDATLALEAEPEPVELAAEEATPAEPLSAERMASLSNQARNLATQASTLSAEIQQMRMAGSSQEQIQERETELAGLRAERAKTLLQVLPQMREEEFKAGASPERLEHLDSAIQEAQATLAEGSQPERMEQAPAPELSAEEREQINQARADFGMEPMADPVQPSIKRLEAEVSGYAQSERELRESLDILQNERNNYGEGRSEVDRVALDERIAERTDQLEAVTQLKTQAEQELAQVAYDQFEAQIAALEARRAEIKAVDQVERAGLPLAERIEHTIDMEPSKTMSLSAELEAAASIDARADIYADVVRVSGDAYAREQATPDVVREWVSADSAAFSKLESPGLVAHATETMSDISNALPAYKIERMQAEVAGYARSEREIRESLEILQNERHNYGEGRSEVDRVALDERIAERTDQLEAVTQLKTQAEQELAQVAYDQFEAQIAALEARRAEIKAVDQVERAGLPLAERIEHTIDMEPSKTMSLSAELEAAASIDARADIYADVVRVSGDAYAREQATPDVVREWVSADSAAFSKLESPGLVAHATETMSDISNALPAYKIERMQAEVAGYARSEREIRESLEILQNERDNYGEGRSEVDRVALDERIAERTDQLEAVTQLKTQAEQEARGALEGLEQQREEQGMFLSEDDANALDEKIAEAAQRVEDMAQAKERSQQELWAAAPELRPAPEQPEPLQFTNNGEPATINLDRFQQPEPPSVERLQAEVEGYGRAEQEAREALAQLQQQRDQLGADLDPNDATALDERIVEASERVDSMALAKTQAQQELWQAAPELRPTEPQPLRFTHQGQPATLDLDRFTAPEQRLSPAVAAKVAELQAVNERAAEKPDVMAEIVSRGTVADATMRHDGIRDGSADRNAVREAARQDLVAFADLDGRPEQQQLAREIGSMMENPDYRDYMASHAPESVSLTVEATQAMDGARGISKEKEADKGMEL